MILVDRRRRDGAQRRRDRPRLPHLRPRGQRRGRDPQPGRLARPTRTSCARRCPACAVFGALPRDASLEVPERHLGLVPVAERDAARTRRDRAARRSGRRALRPRRRSSRWRKRRPGAARRGVGARRARRPPRASRSPAVPRSPSTTRRTSSCCGARAPSWSSSTRSPTRQLPDADALILAGGFPEVFGAELAANPLKHDIAAFNGPILAECGGLLYLAQTLDGREMCGVLPVEAHMTDRLTLGYREAVSLSDHPVWPRGHDRSAATSSTTRA